MQKALLAGLGGMLGSILRYAVNIAVYNWLNYPAFPYGTFIVNIVGCLFIGFLGGLAELRFDFTPELKIFIFFGILGGFTTFSSFGFETFNLLREGQLLYAFLNVSLQVVLGLGAILIGFEGARFLL